MDLLKNLKKPYDLADCYKPVLYTGRFLLIYPYRFQNEGILTTSEKLEWFIFIASTSSLFLLSVFQIEARYFSTNLKNPLMLMSLLRFLLTVLHFLIHNVKSKTNHRHFVNIVRQFQELNNFFRLSEKNIKNSMHLSVLVMLSMILLAIGSLIIIIFCLQAPWSTFLSSIMFSYNVLNFNFNEMNYILSFGLIAKFVEEAHEMLKNYKSVVQVAAKNSSSVKEIRLAYRKILDLKAYINEVYSLQMISTITHVFIESVFFVFLNILIFQEDMMRYTDPVFMLISFYILHLGGRLVLIIWVCHGLKEALVKTGTVIHDLFSTPQDYETKEEVLNENYTKNLVLF